MFGQNRGTAPLTDGRDVNSAWLRHNTGYINCFARSPLSYPTHTIPHLHANISVLYPCLEVPRTTWNFRMNNSENFIRNFRMSIRSIGTNFRMDSELIPSGFQMKLLNCVLESSK
jgi:hypothetical protein